MSTFYGEELARFTCYAERRILLSVRDVDEVVGIKMAGALLSYRCGVVHKQVKVREFETLVPRVGGPHTATDDALEPRRQIARKQT